MYIIGLVGPFGSGCSYVGRWIEKHKNYKYISLSNELKNLFKEQYPRKKATRKDLQNFGNIIRKEHGNDYLSHLAFKEIEKEGNCNYVVDSIRNPAEIEFFQKHHAKFFLFGIFADPDERWKRVKKVYDDDRRAFKADDERDSGEKCPYGQRVTDSFRMSDIIILNNKNIVPGNENESLFEAELKDAIDLIEGNMPFRPSPMETYMCMAYASSLRSSCLKRKVGAVIVDSRGNVFSSGYNEVPATHKSCLSEYGKCYRDGLKDDFRENLNNVLTKEKDKSTVFNLFKDNFKILDYCRALHAEENAILNVARVGASSVLSESTLYTSTYPCNLCANKIAQVGIKNVVYFEPYPMEEAKKILSDQKVTQIPFHGVTYNGYFRLMEVIS